MPMEIQGKQKWRHVSLKHLQVLGSIGLIPIGMGLIMPRVQGQSSASLRSVCVGIAPSAQPKAQPTMLQNLCCQSSKKAQCLRWQQIFPAAVRLRPPTVQRPAAANSFSPRLDEFGNSVGSGGAAKDAVIQVGITKALNAIAPTLKSLDITSKVSRSSRRPNFFQRVRSGYERVLGPRELKSGAILTPQVDMNMDLGQFNVDAMKLGVEIKF
jgi:hypothetical protein